jgi:hypothetical protein
VAVSAVYSHLVPAQVNHPPAFDTDIVPFIVSVHVSVALHGRFRGPVVTVPPRLQVQLDQLASLILPPEVPPELLSIAPAITDVLHLMTAKPEVRVASFPPVSSALTGPVYGVAHFGNSFAVQTAAEAVPAPTIAITAAAAIAARPSIFRYFIVFAPCPPAHYAAEDVFYVLASGASFPGDPGASFHYNRKPLCLRLVVY